MSQTELTVEDLRENLGLAATPALLMLLAHVTDDPSVLREQWRPNRDSLPASGLDEAVDDDIRRFWLERIAPLVPDMASWPAEPSAQVLHAIRDWALGDEVDVDDTADLLRAAFVAPGHDPRGPRWTKAELAPERDMRVIVVGAGLSGLLAGLRMKQAGIDVTIIEKDDDVGGTWYENTYPDCRIDVHSHIYTYSFFPHDWPSYFSRQEVILDYLRRFARENGLLEHIRFGTAVTEATWDDEQQVWWVRTRGPDGEREEAATVLVSAVGQLNRPAIPDIEGIERFSGPAFHSAHWDHSIDFTGKRVAVIGTGASAIQIIPALSREVGQLTIFQRSAPWLQPTPELREDIPDDERWMQRAVPLYRAYYRFSIFLPRAIGRLGAVTVDPDYPPTERAVSAANEQMRQVLTDYLMRQVGDDAELAAKVIPDYPPGSKRIVRDDGTWISTLKRDNVELLSERVERIDETGVITSSGRRVECDVIVFGTGFTASDFLTPMRITGSEGRDLHERWGIDACAYMGMTVPQFPNLFCLYGPNTNLVVHGNLVFFMECQSVYLLSAIESLLRTGAASMSLDEDVFAAYRDEVTAASARRAWGWSKTHSWYQNAEGRSTIMWPLPAQRYVAATAAVDPEHYHYRPINQSTAAAQDSQPKELSL